MKRTADDAALNRDAACNLWRNTLSQIPSLFGRLVYIASLRNANNGRYEHHGLSLVFGEEEANHALKKSHVQAFREWLTFNLEQQVADVELYLSGLEEDRASVLKRWLRLTPYRNLVPSAAKHVERRLYVADLTTVLEVLKNASAGAAPDPGASPRP